MKTLSTYKEIEIKIGAIVLKGHLRIGKDQKGLILFSHGSGSSRFSTRNNSVADMLLEDGFSSLLFDLLTQEEDLIYENRFNIELLTDRLISVTQWLLDYELTANVPLGYFGASTGAASALGAAAKLGNTIKAVVSRGGRPDLAKPVLSEVQAPTLLLVGGNDEVVIGLNKEAQAALNTVCELDIIEGASHLFEEPGKLEIVAKLTSEWFHKYLK